MTTTRLASFPFARQGQVPAGADTMKVDIDALNPVLITPARQDMAYLLLRNTTKYVMRYFYNTSNYDEGMILNPNDTARLVCRQAIYAQLETGSGIVRWDIGIG